jgi:hypothetical protein
VQARPGEGRTRGETPNSHAKVTRLKDDFYVTHTTRYTPGRAPRRASHRAWPWEHDTHVQPVAQSATAAVIGYTLFHCAAFVALGLAAVAVTHLARREPHVLAGALLTFVVAEVGFYSLVALLRETTLTGTLTWQQIAAGNLIGCYLLGARIWRAHPELRREFADALGANG